MVGKSVLIFKCEYNILPGSVILFFHARRCVIGESGSKPFPKIQGLLKLS